MEMYWSLGGPKDDVLFDPESKYSPYCHIFIIVHPDVLIVSKDNVGEGFLVYLGPKKMWSTDYKESPYKQTEKDGSLFPGITQEEFNLDPRPDAGWIDSEVHLPPTVSNMSENVTHTPGQIFYPENLSIEESNKHLVFGFYNPFEGYQNIDRRMLPGEFVIIDVLNEAGEIVKMLRIESTAYSWRSSMRDNNPNLLHRFFQLVTGSYLRYDTPDGRERYESLYPVFTPYNEKSIKKQIEKEPYVVWPQDVNMNDPEYLMTKESRMKNIWLAFINTVPLHKQKDVSEYLDYLYTKRGELITWLRQIENSREYIDPAEFSRRMIDLILVARRFARETVKNGQDRVKGRRKTLKDITKSNIRNLVMKEEGSSLYKLVREMDRYKEESREN